ncbi:MAG: sugar phosphate isomerase/epimerase family protein [Armatimonadota bacterium]
MKVAGSTLSFSKQPLEVALQELSNLGFGFVDIGAMEGWAHINPSEVASQPEKFVEQIGRLCEQNQLKPVAFNAGLGTDNLTEQRRRLEGLCIVAQKLNVPVITLGTAKRGTPLDQEVQRLNQLVSVARKYGITVAIEPHFFQIAENPQVALTLVERVKGLKITLDPSHFAIQGLRLDDYRFLLPHVAHVHFRDAGSKGWNEVQVPMGKGQVEFVAIVKALKEIGYDGAISCEYIDTIGELDIRENLRALRSLLLSLIAVNGSARYHIGGETAERRRKKMRKIPVAVQLYSVREDCAKDLLGTLKAIAEMGYEGVEFAGYHGRSAEELRKILDDLGLKVAGTHTGIDTLRGDELKRTIEFNQTLGNKFLIIPWIGEEWRRTKEDWLRFADFLNELAEKVKPEGMFVGYHNHHFEFQQQFDGQNLWDILFSATKPEVVMQLDTGNAMHGGISAEEVVNILKRYPGRAKTIHLKEFSSTNPKAILGEGEVKWKEVLTLCDSIGGTEWFIIEQETYAYTPIECVRKCLENLKAITAEL